MKIRTLCFSLLVCTCCNNDDFLDGFNRNELFAPPTTEELNAVMASWNSRDLAVDDFTIEQDVEVLDNGTRLKIVSFKVSGYKEYGALIVPKSDEKLPVRMLLGGFGIDAFEFSVVLEGGPTGGKPFILALPAFRGQSLSVTINGTAYKTPLSEGPHCDAFEGGADDAIAFLNVIEASESTADVVRSSIRGGSRGATVALLAAERDPRFKAAIGIAGPADLMELTSQNENDATYQCQFLEGLVNGTSTIQKTRRKMIASSPLYFAEHLPDTQMHLAADDRIVPVSQGTELQTRLAQSGNQHLFQLYVYEGRDHSNIASDNQDLNSRVEDLLEDL